MVPRRAAKALALLAALAAAPAGARDARPLSRPSFAVSQGPLPRGETAAWTHAPYRAGDCSICHQGSDPAHPGPLVKGGNELCYSCHAEIQEAMARRYRHQPAAESCLLCHNAHNSRHRKLLHVGLETGCLDCHLATRQAIEKSKVRHRALQQGKRCASCHDPHGASVERLLHRPAFDTCLGCHSADDARDARGVPLTNFERLLAENPVWHAPVAARDCTACHRAHGSSHFRMLVAEYPAAFYTPYDPRAYALCFGCHDEKVVGARETRTATNFRDGARNLHWVHVNRGDRGHTCRACHEVHAGKQAHQIRDGVPYGPKGWVLRIHYTRTPTGGSCARTCHESKTYVNRAPAGSARTSPRPPTP